LDIDTTKTLASCLIISKLDYCNSFLFGLPDSALHCLQFVQNSLARAIVPSVRRHHHITPLLQSLHWLPITKRIFFKMAVVTFKAFILHQPPYLSDLLHPLPQSARRSANKNLLSVPFVKSATGRRSFSFAAPTIWNSLISFALFLLFLLFALPSKPFYFLNNFALLVIL
jgi:hypothetical protein